jgi:hypothetical protein
MLKNGAIHRLAIGTRRNAFSWILILWLGRTHPDAAGRRVRRRYRPISLGIVSQHVDRRGFLNRMWEVERSVGPVLRLCPVARRNSPTDPSIVASSATRSFTLCRRLPDDSPRKAT